MESIKLLEIQKNPLKALEFAKTLKKENKFEEALEMLEWFHFNVLSIKPSVSGVRRSFALSDWLKLSEVYPKAKERLIEIKNETINKIRNGNWIVEDFHDVESISAKLNDRETPVQIFKLICNTESDIKKIERCFNIVLKYLVEKGEVELCRKYIGYPLERVNRYINQCKELEEFHKKKLQEMSDSEEKNAFMDGPAKAHERIYIERMDILVRALKMLGRDNDIKQVYQAGKGIIPDEDYEKIFK